MVAKDVARCAVTDIFTVHETLPYNLKAAIEGYLEPFAQPQGESKDRCLKCDEPQGGFLGRFTWGLQHGEGFCSKCKWPARAYHEIKDPEGGDDLMRFTFVLQYHPDVVKPGKP